MPTGSRVTHSMCPDCEAARQDVVEIQIAADRAHRIVSRLADCETGGPVQLFPAPEKPD